MTIDDLTVGQAKELAKQFSAPAQNGTQQHQALGHYCVVRAYAAGVHAGIVASVADSLAGREVCLRETRRIWSWQGALSCSEIADSGITGGKLSVEIVSNFISGVIEIIPTSEVSENCLRNFK
jgi:hypothetical protein